MSLGTLVLIIGIVALLLTFIVVGVMKKSQNWVISYLQNFTGALFIFSGWVKAVDPLGTAYKMEQYFAEFETTFDGTWFSFLSPLFPWLAEYAIAFSVFMIIFEIVLGLMLIIGARPKLTSWAFFLLVLFFTFLTGFTYLTGYVPNDVNFFEFGQWTAFQETNMKVTDCGCFGDFIKLKPKTSFFKDIFLLVPALIFLWGHKRMHRLFSPVTRSLMVVISTLALLVYCMSNYVWNLPHTDFRPFKENADVAAIKAKESEAMENIEVLAYKVTNKESGETLEIPFDQYLKEFKKYPKEEWELEQIVSEPEIEPTKISDFEIGDVDGNDITEEILNHEGYHFMIVAYKIPNEVEVVEQTVYDTIYVVDTMQVEGFPDSVSLKRRVDEVQPRQVRKNVYSFTDNYLGRY
jgi:uncharacterized membrane protein YphA (DoxX/SURF4 family)